MFAIKTSVPTLFDEFNTLNSLFDSRSQSAGELRPAADVYDAGDAFVVSAELPGVEEKDIDIQFANNVLSIRAERKVGERENRTWHRREISQGTFSRSMKFTIPVDSANISASYKNGVLEITLPKDESLKARKIEVSVA